MKIGEVAVRAGLRPSAIRYYEQAGLLPKPPRAGGQRRYSESVLERIAVVEFARQCGFTVREIRLLFHGFRDNTPVSVRWQDLARRKIEELDDAARRIAVMKDLLGRALQCQCLDVDECGRKIMKSIPTSK